MYKFFKIFLILIFIFPLGYSNSFSNENKIKIGLLVPMSGDNKDLGQSIIKSTRMALNDIKNNNIEIHPEIPLQTLIKHFSQLLNQKIWGKNNIDQFFIKV